MSGKSDDCDVCSFPQVSHFGQSFYRTREKVYDIVQARDSISAEDCDGIGFGYMFQHTYRKIGTVISIMPVLIRVRETPIQCFPAGKWRRHAQMDDSGFADDPQ